MKVFLRIGVIVLIVLLAFGLTRGMAQFGGFFKNPLLGEAAPDFTLDTTQDKNINMTTYRDSKPAILFFWATWCPHCQYALKGLKEESSTIKQEGIKLILVNVGESKRQVSSYLNKNGIDFEVLLDQANRTAENYNVIGIPAFYFVNKAGIVVDTQNVFPSNYAEILN